MQGPVGRWCGRLATAVIDFAELRRWPLGYIEFHHAAVRFEHAGSFWNRAYGGLRALAAAARSEGRTSFEAPLQALIDRLPLSAPEAGHAILITDGIPVVGDATVKRQQAELRRRGWRIHSLFVGHGAMPEVLCDLARTSAGLCVRVRPLPGGAFTLEEVGS